MAGSSWWDKSTGLALLTILLWASLAALTSRVTSVSPLVLVGKAHYCWLLAAVTVVFMLLPGKRKALVAAGDEA